MQVAVAGVHQMEQSLAETRAVLQRVPELQSSVGELNAMVHSQKDLSEP